MNIKEIEAQARKELQEERHREAVEKCKEKMRRAKWYHRIFPWEFVIVIKRRTV